MGLFSRKKKVEEAVFTIPSMDEQKAMAKASVDLFLKQITNGWDLTQEGSCECAKFKIAGITNYCGFSDVGLIRGYTFKAKENPYDKTAIGIAGVDSKGKQSLLGYIPKVDKKDFKNFSEDADHLIFVGYIKRFVSEEDGKQGINGVIKVLKGEAGSAMYNRLVEDTQLIMGAFKGYYKDEDIRNNPDELRWTLEDHF